MFAAVLSQLIALTAGACMEGTQVRCSLPNCSYAVKVCEYPGFGPCECLQPATTTDNATVHGKYLIAGIWYAVPGPGSNQVYSAESVTGTTISTTTGTESSISVGVKNGADFLGLIEEAISITYGQEWSHSSTTEIDSKVTYTTDNTIEGPSTDSIDHNFDQVVLVLHPEIKFTGTSVGGQLQSVKWAIDASRGLLYQVEMRHLNGVNEPPAWLLTELSEWGQIVPADLPHIRDADPYALDPEGLGQPDAGRFECVEQLAYIPGLPNTTGYEISNNYTSTYTTSVSHSYSVELALSGTFMNQKLNASNTWTWRNSSSTANYAGGTSSMRVNLHHPSAAYTGDTVLNVYVDKIYKTLMYSFLQPEFPTANCW